MPGSLGQKESHCFSAPLMFSSKHLLMVLQATWLTSCVLFSPPVLRREEGFVLFHGAFFTFESVLFWEGKLVCFAIFRLLCNYAREGVSKHHGLHPEKEVVFL